MPDPGEDWLVTCSRPSRRTDPPSVVLLVQTQLTRVPAKQQAMRNAIDQLKAMGVSRPEVIDARPYGARPLGNE